MSLDTKMKKVITQFYNELIEEQKLNLFVEFVELLEEQELVSVGTEEYGLYWSHSGEPLIPES